jgi:cadmium resistance protein CadD (predicted permease)
MLLEGLAAFGLIAASFAATNIDNLALLVGWRLAGRGRPGQLLAGHLLGMIALLLLASVFGLGAKLIPVHWIGVLGVVPILIGSLELYRLFRARGNQEARADSHNGRGFVFVVATTQVANGVDTVLVFGPLIADTAMGLDLFIALGFITMVLLWYALARFLETHASQLAFVERYGHWVAPVVLIVVGLYILDNTATDALPGM